MIRSILTTLCTILALLAGPGAMAADVNQASAAELEAVKGIGPALSGKILSARQQGAFKSWADLVERVSGMGPGSAARLSQNGLTVAGAAYAPVAVAPDKAAKPVRDTAAKKPAKDAAAAKTPA
ncbi:MAG: helix-hairpin-helix domain-containing protein [Pseudomonadota bacterium]